LRLSKERINNCLELLLSEVARRRSVILAEAINDAVPVQSKPVSEEPCRVSRFALGAWRRYGARRLPKERLPSLA
jgi:hypothetical protein